MKPHFVSTAAFLLTILSLSNAYLNFDTSNDEARQGYSGFQLVVVVSFFVCIGALARYFSMEKKPGGESSKAKVEVKVEAKAKAEVEVKVEAKDEIIFFDNSLPKFDALDIFLLPKVHLGERSYRNAKISTVEIEYRNGAYNLVAKAMTGLSVSKEVFESRMRSVGTLPRHDNVLPLWAYFYSEKVKVAFYSYVMCVGLDQILKGRKSAQPSWASRIKIILGAARGLAHIHASSRIHGDVKSSSVLVTNKGEGLIADCGLGHFFSCEGSRGYRDPDWLEHQRPSIDTDVYEFGIILLEVASGKPVVNDPELSKKSLDLDHRIIDEKMVKKEKRVVKKECMCQLVFVTTRCLENMIDMDEVVFILEDIAAKCKINV